MRLLLDTHAVIWALRSPERLSDAAAAAISDSANALLISAASAHEISTKVRLGKLEVAVQIAGAFRDHVRRLGGDQLPITIEDALLAGGMDWHHRDPFDRLLAAQAMRHDARLVTRDRVFDDLAGVATLW